MNPFLPRSQRDYNFLKLKNFSNQFDSFNRYFDDSKDRIHSRKKGEKKKERKSRKKQGGTRNDGWNQYVPDYKERVDVIERQQKRRKAMVTRNDWLSDISNKKPRKYVRKERSVIHICRYFDIDCLSMCRFKSW